VQRNRFCCRHFVRETRIGNENDCSDRRDFAWRNVAPLGV